VLLVQRHVIVPP